MKHFGRSLLNPTLAATRRDFSAPLPEKTASCAQAGCEEDAESDSVMRLAFRKARAARDILSVPADAVSAGGARRA